MKLADHVRNIKVTKSHNELTKVERLLVKSIMKGQTAK